MVHKQLVALVPVAVSAGLFLHGGYEALRPTTVATHEVPMVRQYASFESVERGGTYSRVTGNYSAASSISGAIYSLGAFLLDMDLTREPNPRTNLVRTGLGSPSGYISGALGNLDVAVNILGREYFNAQPVVHARPARLMLRQDRTGLERVVANDEEALISYRASLGTNVSALQRLREELIAVTSQYAPGILQPSSWGGFESVNSEDAGKLKRAYISIQRRIRDVYDSLEGFFPMEFQESERKFEIDAPNRALGAGETLVAALLAFAVFKTGTLHPPMRLAKKA